MPLSPTEQKVLALYDQGKSYKEISRELDISLDTVKTYAKRILVKTLASCLRNAAYLHGGQRINFLQKVSAPERCHHSPKSDRQINCRKRG